MLAVASRLGPYEIVGPLGAGGMGEVYRARDTRLGREVAVKVLPEPFANDADKRARFEREARAVAALSHPNILAIHDYGTHEAVTYAIMELLEGETLRGRLEKGPLPWREVVEIGAAIADGLAAAHAKGIVHRDLKPENLFLTTDGRVKILDFGLARVTALPGEQLHTAHYDPVETHAGTVLGTVGYMSPEQVRGQPAEAASDLFSLGCVLQELVTGQRAFRRDSAVETMHSILHDEPADLSASEQQIPAELGRVIGHCLVKSVLDRVPSARDLAIALRATASGSGLLTASPRKVVEGVAVLPFENVGGDPKTEPPASRGSSRRVAWILAALAPVALLAGGGYFFTRDTKAPDAGTQVSETKAVEALAVLPFENVGGDAKTEYLSDGLAEHLINSFSQVRRQELKVRPFTSVARYKRQKPDAPTMGRELNVQVLVTGTLHQQGDDLSISVALVDTRDDNQLWGHRYQGQLGGILALQDQIARDVAANLRLRLTGEEDERLTKRYTADPEAYLLYREAMYHFNKFTREGLKTGIEYGERAIKKDPNYALAYVGLARCHILLGTIHLGPRETHPGAREYVARALKIDDTLADAHSALGVISLFHDWDWAAAERELNRAIAIDPGVPLTRNILGFYLAAHGRLPEALASIQRGQELDPLTAARRHELAHCYNWMRQYDQAIVEARKALELDPAFFPAYGQLIQALTQQAGRHDEAIAELQKGPTALMGHPLIKGLHGYALVKAGRIADARKVLDELKDPSQRKFGCAFAIARLHAALGEKDEAFQWLKEAGNERDPYAIWIKVDPTLDSLRSDPRFALVLKEMVLPADVAEREPVVQAVAVLPFTYTEGDPTTEMLSETLAGHISDSLRQAGRRDLKIRPPSSVSRYVRQRPDTLTIGRELNVPLLVTGTMRAQGNELKITVEVVDAREDNLLWHKPYSCRLGETLDLDVQDQIVQDVAANLGLRLTDEEQRRLTRRRTVDKEAYNLYRETLYQLNKFTPEGLTAGIKAGKQAIEKDSKYALAYAAVARCYILRGTLYEGPKKAFPEARTYVAEALKFDPNLPDAHAALAVILLFHDWDWPAVERELQQALTLDPGVPLTWNFQGFSLAIQGRLPEALVAIRRGQELDPLSPGRRNELAMCFNWMRDGDRALVEAEKVLELDPNFPLAYRERGLAYIQKRMPERAIAVLKEAIDRGQKHPRVKGMLGYAYAVAERREEARGILEELKGLSPGRFAFAFPIAQIHAALGETDAAFEWLQKALDERDSGVVWIKVDHTLDNLRSDPRFAQVLRDMKLPP